MLRIHMNQNINQLINKREYTGLRYLNDSKAFTEYSNYINIYKNIVEYNLNRKRKILVAFHDIITDILSNTRFNPIVTELLIKGRKLGKE